MSSPGRLVENLAHFVRVLRGCGIPIGPGRLLDAVHAVRTVGITRRDDFYWTLHAVLVSRRAHRALFDQAFHVFWRNPRLLERMLGLMVPELAPQDPDTASALSRRVGEAMGAGPAGAARRADEEAPRIEVDASLTWSDRDLLRTRDFEQMSAEEVERARRAIARMRLPLDEVPTRRQRIDPRGARLHMRATLRGHLRGGHGGVPLVRSRARTRTPPLVILCDVSGSMARYSRMLLHFVHGVTGDRDRVHTFVFGTRLTNITRYLRERDVDAALARVAAAVEDWSAGTRIGQSIGRFNRHWSRRVLGQGAVVLLISDGLDRDAGAGLEVQMERLHKSCRRLVWLNPLLRYEGFEPRALGMRAMLPHVDELRTVHNLESLEDLVDALSRDGPRTEEGVSRWLSRTP